MQRDISNASQKIADIRSQIIYKCTSEKEENKLLEELEAIIEAIQLKDSNAWNAYYAQIYQLKIDLRKKKERYIRNIFPHATLEDIQEIIGIESSIQSLVDAQANEIDTSSLLDELKKDGTQRQSWLARNAVSQKRIHALRTFHSIQKRHTWSVSMSYFKDTRRLALAYMDPNAPNGEIDLVADMKSGLFLFCETQLRKGKTSIYKGKSREGGRNDPIHDMNCRTYWSNCSIM